MERDKTKKLSKKKIDSDYSDNQIHVNINVGTSDNHKDDNSNNSIKNVSQIKEVKDKITDNKKEIDNTDLLLLKLKSLIKEFNLKKEDLIKKKIDIPNEIFDIPNIEINSKNDIIKFIDILKDKLNKLNNILINTKTEVKIEPSKTILPTNPFMNNMQPNIRSPFNAYNPYAFNPYNPHKPFPTGDKTNIRTPIKPTPTPVTPAPVTPAPVTPAPTPTSPTELTEIQKEIEKNLLMFLEEDFGKYEKYYFDNKDTTDVSRLRRLIQIQTDEITRLKKIKNDLFLQKNQDKVDEIIISVQGNKSDSNIALQNLMDIKPDDNGGEESDFNENDPPPYQEPNIDIDLQNRRNVLLAYKSRMNNTGRSPNGFLLVDRELNNNLDFIKNAIDRGNDLTAVEKEYVLSLYNIMDNSNGVFEPAKAYRNINSRVLPKTDILSLEQLQENEGQYILLLNGNQEVIDNQNNVPIRFDINGDIFNSNIVNEPTGGRRPGEIQEEPQENEEEFKDDERTKPIWGHWYDGFFGVGQDGQYQDGL